MMTQTPNNVTETLLFPQARWNLTGLFMHDTFILDFIRRIRDHLGVTPFATVHGAPLSYPWNGGRVDPDFTISREQIRSVVEAYQDRQTGCMLTFSNRFVQKGHLDDPDCNDLLDLLNSRENQNNGVIVASDILAEYIRDSYPGLHLMASIIKVTCEGGEGNLSYYKDLESRFDSYVVDVNDNDNLDLLEQLDKSKAEILVNSCCVYQCPHKAEHYDMLVKVHDPESGITMDKILDYQKNHCKAYPVGRQLGKGRSHCLSLTELETLYTMGFRNFKLQGRYTTSLTGILFDICHYVFNPNGTGPLVFHSFS